MSETMESLKVPTETYIVCLGTGMLVLDGAATRSLSTRKDVETNTVAIATRDSSTCKADRKMDMTENKAEESTNSQRQVDSKGSSQGAHRCCN